MIGDGSHPGKKPHVIADQNNGENSSEVPEVLARQARTQKGLDKVVQSFKKVFHRIL